MNHTYKILNAITLNATGSKYNAIAAPATKAEIIQHRREFGFDFIKILTTCTVYKIYIENAPDILQGLVGFYKSTGFLQCENMEVNEINKRGKAVYGGVGKLIIALCCKISNDAGFGGYISFTAKSILFNYYTRMGAKRLGTSNIMFLDESAAQKLIEKYF